MPHHPQFRQPIPVEPSPSADIAAKNDAWAMKRLAAIGKHWSGIAAVLAILAGGGAWMEVRMTRSANAYTDSKFVPLEKKMDRVETKVDDIHDYFSVPSKHAPQP